MNKRIAILLVFLSLFACKSSRQINYDYTYLYSEEQKIIKPFFKIFHRSADSSDLYFQLESDNILHGKLGADSTLTARVLCKYKVYENANSSKIIDSATVAFYNYGENASNKILQSRVKMAVPSGGLYPLEIRFRDQYRDLNVAYFQWIDKRLNANEQFFLLKKENQVLINQRMDQGGKVSLHKSPLLDDGVYELRYATNDFHMTPPPFAERDTETRDLNIDSMKKVIFVNDSITINSYSAINELSSPNNKDLRRFYFYHYYAGFPEITKYRQMIQPLRYITTSSEFKKLNTTGDIKKALDEFWLKIGGSKEKAEKMIQSYYERVEMANQRFTSYKEGWKTDRGIIFIVYGEPTTIHKGINSESWIYGEENHILSVKFQFNLVDDEMSNNNYQLIRNADYKNNWYRAVDNWRQGKIY